MTKFITQRRFAEALALSDRTIARYIDEGRIKAVQMGRFRRIPASELERFAAELQPVRPTVKAAGAA